MRVACVQFDIAWEEKRANVARVGSLLRASPPGAGSLVVLPEMFATGFSMNVGATAEEEGGPTEQALAGLARELGLTIIAGVVSRAGDGRGSNCAVAYGAAGERIAAYAKLHPFSYAKEDQFFASGSEVVTFPLGGFTVAPFVCYDLRFPEAFRAATKNGADLFPVIANWPASREDHWVTLLRARAIENQAYVVGVNRCGRDPNAAYAGRSMIIDPRGQIVVDAGDGEKVIAAEVEVGEVEAHRKSFPALRDRREDL